MGLAGQLIDDWSVRPWHLAAWRNSSDPKFVFSTDDLTIQDANPAAEILLHTVLGDLKGQPISRVLDAPYMVRLREAQQAGRLDEVLSGATLIAAASGPPSAFAVSLLPLGPSLCLCRLARGPAVEADLRRLNWALAAYARSSAALIRASSFEELVAGVCEAIVGENDYLAAAVGLVEHGQDRPVRLVATAGTAIDYVQNLSLSWSEDLPGGRGPTGVAIRSGQPFVMQDALREPIFSHWRRRAVEAGIRSSVTVPFSRDGKSVSGVLIVYAGQAEAFGASVLDVFMRLSREMAFALKVEDDRAHLRAAEEARRAAEEAAQESLAELARAARMISVATFASSLAHEVNQPVAAIVANSEAALRWLSRDPPNLAEARAALERITRDAGRTSAVVGRTRGMLTKDLGRRQAVDLNALLDEALQFTEVQRKRAAVKVELDLAPDLPVVNADPVQIQQVMVNLISNAIDAMRGVSARRRILRLATAVASDGEVVVSVADTGSGVDEDARAQVFTHLFTTKPEGMGLGLPISKAIVEAHDGRLEMGENTPGGAVFRFYLPAREAE